MGDLTIILFSIKKTMTREKIMQSIGSENRRTKNTHTHRHTTRLILANSTVHKVNVFLPSNHLIGIFRYSDSLLLARQNRSRNQFSRQMIKYNQIDANCASVELTLCIEHALISVVRVCVNCRLDWIGCEFQLSRSQRLKNWASNEYVRKTSRETPQRDCR